MCKQGGGVGRICIANGGFILATVGGYQSITMGCDAEPSPLAITVDVLCQVTSGVSCWVVWEGGVSEVIRE